MHWRFQRKKSRYKCTCLQCTCRTYFSSNGIKKWWGNRIRLKKERKYEHSNRSFALFKSYPMVKISNLLEFHLHFERLEVWKLQFFLFSLEKYAHKILENYECHMFTPSKFRYEIKFIRSSTDVSQKYCWFWFVLILKKSKYTV